MEFNKRTVFFVFFMKQHFALLPPGLQDILPPKAEQESACVETMMKYFGSLGYERVKPPLVEFESSMLSGSGVSLSEQTFRLFDPFSHQNLVLRSDTTLQVARIAKSRLAKIARPLRLSYAGQVLRTIEEQTRPQRQFGQIGCELIGSLSTQADVEVILLAAMALTTVGVLHLSCDLCLPTLVPNLCRAYSLSQEQEQAIYQALKYRNPHEIHMAAGGGVAKLLEQLISLAGPARPAMTRLTALPLPPIIEPEVQALNEIVQNITQNAPQFTLTVDPVEVRDFKYEAGVCFTFFAHGVPGELGRGGRYTIDNERIYSEPATGFTLYTDTILRALPLPKPQPRIFVPFETSLETREDLRKQGWIVIHALETSTDERREAKRLYCSHVFDGRAVQSLKCEED